MHISFKQSCGDTHFSCVVKISKEPLESIWLIMLRKGMDTLEEEDQSEVTQGIYEAMRYIKILLFFKHAIANSPFLNIITFKQGI